eukprot:gnl/MRDRNA2_/MRDRNA2_31532_c0_seq1.p1 gnl/MRDRNA2_/MRDRNA2_31532_c0~~gnl/MRDRNA2_/MRDRNA2_31532_c0_seq1.p1  ORF type:complete len:142 (+),score=11.04 gnl/MRDRNA2_/MRDRNA2_31532_c0_seq1:11-436(+)
MSCTALDWRVTQDTTTSDPFDHLRWVYPRAYGSLNTHLKARSTSRPLSRSSSEPDLGSPLGGLSSLSHIGELVWKETSARRREPIGRIEASRKRAATQPQEMLQRQSRQEQQRGHASGNQKVISSVPQKFHSSLWSIGLAC